MARYTAAQALQQILAEEHDTDEVDSDDELELPLSDEERSDHVSEADEESDTQNIESDDDDNINNGRQSSRNQQPQQNQRGRRRGRARGRGRGQARGRGRGRGQHRVQEEDLAQQHPDDQQNLDNTLHGRNGKVIFIFPITISVLFYLV